MATGVSVVDFLPRRYEPIAREKMTIATIPMTSILRAIRKARLCVITGVTFFFRVVTRADIFSKNDGDGAWAFFCFFLDAGVCAAGEVIFFSSEAEPFS